MEIKVKYFDENMPKLEKIGGEKSDWIDLRVSSIKKFVDRDLGELSIPDEINFEDGELRYYAGDVIWFGLGVAMELPKGYEAHIVPRSSTFKHYGLIQTNHMGIIDESYRGDNDEWIFPALAMRDGVIHRWDRIAQFRVVEKMPKVNFVEVKTLGNKDRGGLGSSGRR